MSSWPISSIILSDSTSHVDSKWQMRLLCPMYCNPIVHHIFHFFNNSYPWYCCECNLVLIEQSDLNKSVKWNDVMASINTIADSVRTAIVLFDFMRRSKVFGVPDKLLLYTIRCLTPHASLWHSLQPTSYNILWLVKVSQRGVDDCYGRKDKRYRKTLLAVVEQCQDAHKPGGTNGWCRWL